MSVVEQLIPVGTWKADGLHSSVRFEVQHMGVATFGAGFNDFEADLVSGSQGMTLAGAVKVESFDIEDEGLRPHVMAPDFLDVERFPELTFQSTALRGQGEELTVEGELTIKGETLAVEARGRISEPVRDPYGNQRLALSLEAVIDRTAFGLGWQREMPGGGSALANEVRLLVSLEFVKET